ncbi:MAG: tetratricopeptide repeat protein [Pseudomonadota bacterium]
MKLRFILAMALPLMAGAANAQSRTREEALAAVEKYSRLIEAEPHYAPFHTQRGDACFALGDFQGAAQSYTAAIRLDDAQDRAYFGRGMALGRMGLVDEGIADLDVYIRRHPDSSVAHTKRGVRNIWRNNLVAAERDLARAIELDPNNAEAHDDLGVVHARHKRLELAAHHFSMAIRLDPTYQKAFHNLAIVFFMVKQYAEALQIVDAGLQLDAGSRSSLLLKSGILQAMGRTEEARRIAGQAKLLPEENWSERSALAEYADREEGK